MELSVTLNFRYFSYILYVEVRARMLAFWLLAWPTDRWRLPPGMQRSVGVDGGGGGELCGRGGKSRGDPCRRFIATPWAQH